MPGIMGMGFLTSAIHQWAPTGHVENVDTVFRAPMLADTPAIISAVVTDIDEDDGIVELDMTVKNTKDETRVFGTAGQVTSELTVHPSRSFGELVAGQCQFGAYFDHRCMVIC